VHYATGNLKTAGQFNGSDDYVGSSIPQINTSTAVASISVWAYIPSSWTWINGSVAYFQVQSGWGVGIFRSATNNQLIFAARIGGTVTYGIISYVIQRDAWYHLVFVGNSSTFDAYVNGTKLSGSPASYGYFSGSFISQNFRLGDNGLYGGGGGGYLSGLIDDARIYNRVLSAAEIRRIYLGTE
jgi:hypothetical protein